MTWIDEELEALKKEQEERQDKNFFKAKKGENLVKFYPKREPVKKEDAYGKPKAYFTVNGNMVWGIHRKSPLYFAIIKKLKENQDKDEVTLKILRAGDREKTTYELLDEEA
jgi:flavoprotein